MAQADALKAKIGLTGPLWQRVTSEPPRIPDHTLLRCIGQGSYGEVWLARNVMGAGRAVKIVCRDSFRDARPYEREFSGIQRYEPFSRTNEGLVDVLQIGRNEPAGYFYYVMELADDANAEPGARGAERPEAAAAGPEPKPESEAAAYEPRTLGAELRRRGRLPFEQCLQLGLTLNLALGHLHRHGLIHRDVKPSNIIFVNGVPKLADIGLVTGIEEANTFVGTEGFVPPEGPNSAQADLYALGKVLYEAATGKDRQEFPEPFTRLGLDAESQALMELNTILLKACATDPKDRYGSAEEMNADLALLHSGKSVARHHAAERWLARFKRASLIGATLMVIAVAAWLWQTNQTRQMTKLAAENLALARESSRTAEESRRQTVQLQVANGVRLMDERDLPGALQWFTEALSGVLALGDTNREAMHRIRIGSVLEHLPRLRSVFAQPKPVLSVAISPEGRRVAAGTRGGAVFVYDLESEKEVLQFESTNQFVEVKFSPDGGRVIAVGYGPVNSVTLFDLATGKRLAPPGSTAHPVASWDGRTLLVSDLKSAVQILDVQTGRPLTTWMQTRGTVFSARFSGDGKRVAVLGRERISSWPANAEPDPHLLGFWKPADGGPHDSEVTLQVWNVAEGIPAGEALIRSNVVRYALSSDGARLFVAANFAAPFETGGQGKMAGQVEILDPVNGSALCPVLRLMGPLRCFEPSPDGKRLVVADTEGTRVWSAETGQVLVELSRYGATSDAAFSSDGFLVGSAAEDGLGRVYNSFTGEEVLMPFRHVLWAHALAFSPDDRFLVTGSEDQLLRVWDLALPQPGRILEHPEMPPLLVLFSPDGRTMATVPDVRLWDLKTGLQLGERLPDTGCGMGGAAFSRDGQMIAVYSAGFGCAITQGASFVTTSMPQGLLLYRTSDGQRLLPRLHSDAVVLEAEFSSDGRKLLTVGDDGTIRVWSTETGDSLLPPIPFTNASHACFSPDDRWIGTADGGGFVRIWDALTGGLKHTLAQGDLGWNWVEFSDDTNKVAAGGRDQSITVWDTASGRKLLGPLLHGGRVLGVRFLPSGQQLLSYALDGKAKLWNLEEQDLAVPSMEPGRMAALSEDSRLVLGWSEKSARVFETATGEPLTIALPHTGPILKGGFARDGRCFGISSFGDPARLWPLPSCAEPIAAIGELADVYCGARFQGRIIEADDLADEYRALRSEHPALLQTSAETLLCWHEQTANGAQKVGCWPTVIAHASALLAHDSSKLGLLRLRAEAFAELGRLREAESDLLRTAMLPGSNARDLGLVALLLAARQDQPGFEAAIKHLRTRFAQHPEKGERQATVWYSCLAPHSGDQAAELVQAAELSDGHIRYISIRTLGAALYRTGRFPDAASKFEAACRLHPAGGEPVDFAFLAMAQFRSGGVPSARQSLARGQEKLAALQAEPRRYQNAMLRGPDWSVRMEASVLVSEAAALVDGSQKERRPEQPE